MTIEERKMLSTNNTSVIQNKKIEMLNIEISETKIVLTFKNIVEDNILEELHQLIIN